MRKTFRRNKNQLAGLAKRSAIYLKAIRRTSDTRRWGKEQNLSPNWDSRTERIASLVEPGASIIEFGAGRLVLRKFLPESCTYTPSDLVDRGNGTIVCDLNKALPDFLPYDAAVFSGVLEYVNDVPKLIFHLSSRVNVIVASYAVTDSNKDNRRKHGWVNDYSSAHFIDVFENAGFACEFSEEWESQIIYKFRRI